MRVLVWLLACAPVLLAAGACRAAPPPGVPGGAARGGMVFVGGGTFRMGADDEMPDEAPAHEVAVASFWIDAREVTVEEFSKFVAATGYRTDAERFGWSGVFDRESGGWTSVEGADWRHPEGPSSRAAPDEPVCQVSWRDAAEYARWAGKRLPTEAEWEYAARGGLAGRRYAWGDELRPEGRPVANWWQGSFPARDTGEDGFRGRAPAGSFRPNGYGLYDVGATSGSGAQTGTRPTTTRRRRARTRVGRARARSACCAAAPGCAPRTFAATTASPRAATPRPTRGSTTSASAARATPATAKARPRPAPSKFPPRPCRVTARPPPFYNPPA